MAVRADDVNLGRDKALVELFQSGDGRAFEDLYRRYFQRVFRYCLKRVGDPLEAEEIAQEAFVRAYSAMPRFTGERRFYPWLSVIASRLCVDHHRRRSRTSPSDQVELGVVEGGQEEVIAQVDRDMLAAALERMVPRHREALRLREEEGWSYDRIAGHFGVGVGTIEALLFRARRALRREFHALAGADSRLAALPVLGYMLRRLAGLRTRLGDLSAQAAPMIGASAVSVAVIVGSVASGSGGPVPRSAAAAPRTIPSIEVPAVVTSSVTAPPATKTAPVQPAGSSVVVPKQDPLLQTAKPLGVTTEADAREQAEAMDLLLEAGPLLIGLDPLELLPKP